MSSLGRALSVAVTACLACGRGGFDERVDAGAADAGPPGPDALTGPAIVQSAGDQAALVTSLSTTLPSTPTIGNVLVLVGGGQVSSLQPPTGGTSAWTHAASSTTNPNIEIWFGVADGGSPTITIQADSATAMAVWVSEWTGLATVNTLDAAIGASGSVSPASAGTITTTSAPDLLVFGAASFLPNAFGPPTDGAWTALDTRDNDSSSQTVWYRIAPTAGDIAPTVTETRNSWDAALAAFRIAP